MGNAPPLRVWVYTAILALCMAALLIPARLSVMRETSDVLVAHTQNFLALQARLKRVRVLALGTSLLWAATPPALTPPMPDIAVMRLIKGDLSTGPLRSVIDSLEHTPPEVLVIEANLLYSPNVDTIMQEARHSLAKIVTDTVSVPMEYIGFAGLVAPPLLIGQTVPFACIPLRPAALHQQMTKLITQQNTLLANAGVDASLRDSLLRLTRRGVHIVVLEIRRSDALEMHIAVEKQRWLERWHSALPPGPSVSYLTSPVFQDALYCDGRHMNDAGARRFVPWWTAQLQQLAKGH